MQVQLSIRENDLFVGTLLKSLEIEDLVYQNGASQSRYLARSFVRSADACSSLDDAKNQSLSSEERTVSEGDDKFYEAPDDLVEAADSPYQSSAHTEDAQGLIVASPLQKLFLKPPSFRHIDGLLPCDISLSKRDYIEVEQTSTLDSFVKAQIVVYDQGSSLYDNVDTQVSIRLFSYCGLIFHCLLRIIDNFGVTVSGLCDPCDTLILLP